MTPTPGAPAALPLKGALLVARQSRFHGSHSIGVRVLKRFVCIALAAVVAACAAPPADTPAARTEVVWLGQAGFKITTPGGKVIVTDPWLKTNPLTPAAYKHLDAFGRIDVLMVSHGHFDHIADAPALAQQYNVPLRAPGDLAQTLMTLGVLPANLLPRMNKGGTVEPVPGVKVTAVRAEHSSIYVWKNPASAKDETHPGGEAVGWLIELENGFRIYHAGDTAAFGDMKLIGERYKPDLALVPIGGNFTMDPADAAWAVKELLKPKAVIPMHYGANPLAKGTAQQFVEAMNAGTGTSAIRVIVAVPGQPLSF
jgi:L-ascorbate metabolism protein UlaG (beta-lactamase superfamily)